MSPLRIFPIVFMLFGTCVASTNAQVKGAFEPYKEGRFEQGRIYRVGGIPILELEGAPEALGRAQGKLVEKEAAALMRFFLNPAAMMSGGLPKLKSEALKLEPQIPKRYRKEMKALAEATGREYEEVLTGVAFPDVYRGGGCSTLAVTGPAAEGGRTLLARNLDFFTCGVLDKYGLVVVFRPEGYHAFVSVTWPSLLGVLSGMNEKGLCCAVMEVRSGIRRYDGMPTTLLFRRLLEEADTVDEALKIVGKSRRVVSNNLMLVDRKGTLAVAEIGPGRLEVRRATEGVVFSTNHHREGREFAPRCRRYGALTRFTKANHGKLDAEKLEEALHLVNQGKISVQSMIFDPTALTLDLSMGALPSTKGPFRRLHLAGALNGIGPVLGPDRDAEAGSEGDDAGEGAKKARLRKRR